MAEKLKITLVKSTIGAIPKHKKTVEPFHSGRKAPVPGQAQGAWPG